MADFKFRCPFCGQKLEGEPDWVGEMTECPNCHNCFKIPGDNAAAPPPVATVIGGAPGYAPPPPPPPPARNKLFIFICPECGEVMEMSERKLGQTITCQACGEEVTVVKSETRSCPKCGEEVKISASVCKFCHQRIPPLRPHSGSGSSGAADFAVRGPVRSSGGRSGNWVDAGSAEMLFNAYFWTFSAGLALVVMGALIIAIGNGKSDEIFWGGLGIECGLGALLGAEVVRLNLVYWYWRLIPDEPSPMMHTLLLLVPIFTWYWGFQTYAELGARLENETGSGGAYSARSFGNIYAIGRCLMPLVSLISLIMLQSSPRNSTAVLVIMLIYGFALVAIEMMAMRAFHNEARRLMS